MKKYLFLWLFLTFGISLKAQSQSNGYTIFMQQTPLSPVDAATYIFGSIPASNAVAGNTRNVYLRKSGTIGIAEFLWVATAIAGTNESVSLYVRINNTTDYLIATVSNTNAMKIFSNQSLNIPFVSGDYVEIKILCPTWATNPTTVSLGGYLFINPTP